jgi:hypothetical protein
MPTMMRVYLPINRGYYSSMMASLQKVFAGLQNESAYLQNHFANTNRGERPTFYPKKE